MVDMSAFIAPKSDQLNADDMIAGPRTIRIARVSANPDSAEQPISVFFDGDGGKPFRPCKSMRRVMVAVWGADANQYAGRSMTLFRDPTVTWGGMEVGGIRISHMSHMEREMVMALTATKKARKPYRVLPLKVEVPKPATATQDRVTAAVDALAKRIQAAGTMADLEALTGDAKVMEQRNWLEKNRPDAASRITGEIAERLLALEAAEMPGDGWPGPDVPAEQEAAR